MASPKVDPVKLGVFALLLVDLALIYPIYMQILAEPEIPAGFVAPAPIKLAPSMDTGASAVSIDPPPPDLLSWDPFRAVKGFRGTGGGGGEPEDSSAVVQASNLPIGTDNIVLHGIISLNGQYRALISIEGAPSMEVRQGMTLQGTEIKAVEIRRDAVILSQPGAINTPLRLRQSEFRAQSWFQGEGSDTGSRFGGRIEMRR